MLATILTIDIPAHSTSACLSGWLNPPSIHWTLPPNDRKYIISGINISANERRLNKEEQQLLWSALIASSQLAYEL
jgi:hypothetical protein